MAGRCFDLLLTVLLVPHLFVRGLPSNPGSAVSHQGSWPSEKVLGQEQQHPRRRKQHSRSHHEGSAVAYERKTAGQGVESVSVAVEVKGAKDLPSLPDIDGVYQQKGMINDAPYYEKASSKSEGGWRTPTIYLYFTGIHWVLNSELDPHPDTDNCIAYSKVSASEPLRTTRKWVVKVGSAWVHKPLVRIVIPEEPPSNIQGRPPWPKKKKKREEGRRRGAGEEEDGVGASGTRTAVRRASASGDVSKADTSDGALMGRLAPVYLCYVLDSIGMGMALPALPFFIMSLQASALQLAMVVSSNYMAQTIGCVIMGNVSDRVGRKPVMMGCMVGSLLSYFLVSRSTSLAGVAFGRIVGGMMGGLTPIVQASVADVVPVDARPKFLGRVQACVGAGFVLGPVILTILRKAFNLNTRESFLVAMLFPFFSLITIITQLKETKRGPIGISQMWRQPGGGEARAKWEEGDDSDSGGVKAVHNVEGDGQDVRGWGNGEVVVRETIPRSVMMLVGNGFLLMYAFSIETIYAMFLKDNFGYGESVLSMVFALNGVAVGFLQLVGMKHIVELLGKHMMLVIGNLLLALGMVGIALSRMPGLHFVLFTLHILGYSLADTALVSLISRYAPPSTQGRSMGLNQAAQSTARVISPVVAGLLYELSKRTGNLPLGSLPYLFGSLFPVLGMATPFVLYLKSVEKKKQDRVVYRQHAQVSG